MLIKRPMLIRKGYEAVRCMLVRIRTAARLVAVDTVIIVDWKFVSIQWLPLNLDAKYGAAARNMFLHLQFAVSMYQLIALGGKRIERMGKADIPGP